MSKKAAVFFAVWTSFWCSVFNYVYMMIPALKGHPWIMFICLAVFFGMGSTVKDVPVLMASAMCGVFWGQVDLFLMTLGAFGMLWGGFFPIFVGTVITMILHINYLCNTPVRAVPIIFAGVALTFACQIGFLDVENILGLALSMLFGLVLCGVCAWGQALGINKYPIEV
ncbi:MAG: DUF1097 domain-containing protein [Lachnospiraceae bacterium]|nr:DUF1097 domain-containing protein [Lachnospiraceae bacterium]